MTTVLNELGRGLNRAWGSFAEGWRELMRGASSALTHYVAGNHGGSGLGCEGSFPVPSWSLLAGEVMETKKSVVVRIELPGIDRDEVEVNLEGNNLRIQGEKRIDRAFFAKTYYLRERAYGWFERVVPLPRP